MGDENLGSYPVLLVVITLACIIAFLILLVISDGLLSIPSLGLA